MSKCFQCIGLVGVPRQKEAVNTHKIIYDWLISQGYRVLLENDLSEYIDFPVSEFYSLDEIGKQVDLAIVVGGDGNMLRTARCLSKYNIKFIGVNRGNLGFLTDIMPEQVIPQLTKILAGNYREDPRFLLEASVYSGTQLLVSGIAVNEIVIHPSKIAHMIDYEAYINDRNAFSQRADGIIIATPTGSTAYSLSAGGPIIAPRLDAFIITPMFPHSLSVRPLVIKSDNTIRLVFPNMEDELEVVCDSQVVFPVVSGCEVIIKRSPYEFKLIHSDDYDYFRNLSTKLGWSKKMY